jgi:2-C-methyl-D-erythritol 4-phosphate cytidylyltransferase
LKVSAIIAAAGTGQRLGHQRAKAFVELGGKPMLFYALRTLAATPDITEIIITLPTSAEGHARAALGEMKFGLPVKLTPGGAERQDSVRRALMLVSAESEIVVIHDAARPFATAELFSRCIESAQRWGAAVAGIPVADTLKSVAAGKIIATQPRHGLWQAQTPQAFKRELILRAHASAKTGEQVTDDADLVERLGESVEIVEGSPQNFKITTPGDLEMAEALVRGLV